VILPPGERFDGTTFVQLEGKITKINPNVIEVIRLQPVSGTFDAMIYNKAMELASGQYNYLFH
jgi:hypothetical protein